MEYQNVTEGDVVNGSIYIFSGIIYMHINNYDFRLDIRQHMLHLSA